MASVAAAAHPKRSRARAPRPAPSGPASSRSSYRASRSS